MLATGRWERTLWISCKSILLFYIVVPQNQGSNYSILNMFFPLSFCFPCYQSFSSTYIPNHLESVTFAFEFPDIDALVSSLVRLIEVSPQLREIKIHYGNRGDNSNRAISPLLKAKEANRVFQILFYSICIYCSLQLNYSLLLLLLLTLLLIFARLIISNYWISADLTEGTILSTEKEVLSLSFQKTSLEPF